MTIYDLAAILNSHMPRVTVAFVDDDVFAMIDDWHHNHARIGFYRDHRIPQPHYFVCGVRILNIRDKEAYLRDHEYARDTDN